MARQSGDRCPRFPHLKHLTSGHVRIGCPSSPQRPQITSCVCALHDRFFDPLSFRIPCGNALWFRGLGLQPFLGRKLPRLKFPSVRKFLRPLFLGWESLSLSSLPLRNPRSLERSEEHTSELQS